MKMKIIAAAIVSGFLPAMALAATVQVYPTITATHGGQKWAADMTACISYNGTQQCAQGVPTFTVPDGASYSVTLQPAEGYSGSAGTGCSGTAQGDIVCQASYADGAPIPTVAQQVAKALAAQTTPSPTAPITITQTVSLTAPAATSTDEQAQIAALQQQISILLKQLIALLTAKLSGLHR